MSIVVSGTVYILTGVLLSAGLVGWFVAAGVFVYSAYTSLMQENAIEKANLAIELISQQKNYAVYETTVMWNTVPNGYEVEEWKIDISFGDASDFILDDRSCRYSIRRLHGLVRYFGDDG